MKNSLFAQQQAAKDKAAPGAPNAAPAIKKKSASPPAEKKPSQNNIVTETSQDINAGANDVEISRRASETVTTDYRIMPPEVQLRINNNKAQGKFLLDGIARAFTVEIKTCITDADHKKTLSFLKTRQGFIQSQFISAGLVRIIAEPTFEPGSLKDAMAAEGIHFNFLSKSYLLKK